MKCPWNLWAHSQCRGQGGSGRPDGGTHGPSSRGAGRGQDHVQVVLSSWGRALPHSDKRMLYQHSFVDYQAFGAHFYF